MKSKLFTFTFLFLTTVLNLQAQRSMRIGYVDMEYILQNVPEYQEASSQLDKRVQEWKAEAEQKMQKVEKMKTQLENERALLTRELIEEREEEIAFLEQEALEYQQNRFGPNGDYMIQKKQLVKPVQDQVFTAVQEIAENRNLDFVFDRTSETGMLYAAKEYDVSDQVLRNINRASNRRQLETKEDRRNLEKEEERTVEQDAEITERENAIEDKEQERETLLEERRRQRDSIRAARQKEFEERRARILEERERRKDSIQAARQQNDTIN